MDIKVRLSKTSLMALPAIILIAGITLLLSPLYDSGDQLYYGNAYYSLQHRNIRDDYSLYSNLIGSKEFLHFFLSWISSIFFEKIVFDIATNIIFVFALILALKDYRVPIVLAMFLLVTNYYLYVLYFSSERLKIAITFFLISWYLINNSKAKYKSLITSALAILSHVQVAILYVCMLLAAFKKKHLAYIFNKPLLFGLALFAFVVSVFSLSVLMSEHITYKISSYLNVGSLKDIWKVLVFMFLSVFYSQNKLKTIATFIPLLISALIFGDDRINILAYICFMHYGLMKNRGINFGVFIISLYFAFATYGFVVNVIKFGHGFAQ